MVFNAIIFVSTIAYLVIVEDYYVALPAFMLAFSYGLGGDNARFVVIISSVLLLIVCVFRLFSNELIPGLSEDWWPMVAHGGHLVVIVVSLYEGLSCN